MPFSIKCIKVWSCNLSNSSNTKNYKFFKYFYKMLLLYAISKNLPGVAIIT